MSTEPLAPCDGSSLSARVATAFVKLTLRVFFRRTEVTGIENLTPEGGGLIVSWHPNALIDPALILTSIPRRIVFGARHGLFKWPVLGALMRALGTVPVYRKQDADGRGDDATRRARNDESLDALADAIVDGAYAVLFPRATAMTSPPQPSSAPAPPGSTIER